MLAIEPHIVLQPCPRVATGGNGNQDLDSHPYLSYQARGDSGAIMVGAGSGNVNHRRLNFSNYGSRFDLQGWGKNKRVYFHFIVAT